MSSSASTIPSRTELFGQHKPALTCRRPIEVIDKNTGEIRCPKCRKARCSIECYENWATKQFWIYRTAFEPQLESGEYVWALGHFKLPAFATSEEFVWRRQHTADRIGRLDRRPNEPSRLALIANSHFTDPFDMHYHALVRLGRNMDVQKARDIMARHWGSPNPNDVYLAELDSPKNLFATLSYLLKLKPKHREQGFTLSAIKRWQMLWQAGGILNGMKKGDLWEQVKRQAKKNREAKAVQLYSSTPIYPPSDPDTCSGLLLPSVA